MAPPATLLALLLVPAAVALQADLGKSNDDKKHKPALHGHEKTHHRAGLHEKMRHGPAAHDKPEGAALALHKHGLHGKAEKSGAKHGLHEKTEKTIAKHGLHGKTEKTGAKHGLHGKTEKNSAKHGLHEKTAKASAKHGLHEKTEKVSAKHGLHEKAAKTSARHSLHEKSAAESHGKHRKKKEDAVEEVVEEELVEDDSQCADAENGTKCFSAVTWLRRDGFRLHPEWYPAYGESSSFREVQQMLFSLNKSECPKPCRSTTTTASPAGPVEADTAQGLTTIDDSGWQVFNGCRDASEGEYCYSSILWLAEKGMKKHPEWYPNLSIMSTFREVQEELFRSNKSECTRPCLAESMAAKKFRLARPNSRFAKAHAAGSASNSCEDAAKESKCYVAVAHALKMGIRRHPEEYPGLPPRADFRDVQENLHVRGKHECSMPCPAQGPNATDSDSNAAMVNMKLEEFVEYTKHKATSTTLAAADSDEDIGGPARQEAGSTQHFSEDEQDSAADLAAAEEAEKGDALARKVVTTTVAAKASVLLVNPAHSVDEEMLPRLNSLGVQLL